MIRQFIDIDDYWKVIVYYNVDYGLFKYIVTDFKRNNAERKTIKSIYNSMLSGNAKAVTHSNLDLHTSIVLFNNHTSKSDYINSLVHEAEHIKQAMLEAYNVEDEGEPPAYTIGYLVMRMWEVFKSIKF